MDHNEIERMIHRILATEEKEIDCEQVFSLIARYVDLEVSGEEVKRLLPLVHEHLVQCDMCSDLHETLHELAVMEAQDVLPNVDDLMDEILASTSATTAEPSSDSPEVSRTPSPPRNSAESQARSNPTAFQTRANRHRAVVTPVQPSSWLRWGWAAAAVVLIMAVALGAWGRRQSSQVAQMTSLETFIARADRAVSLQGTAQDPDARGYLFIDETHGRGLLTIDGLNPLPPGQVYQMWFVTETGTVSAGTFTVDSAQRGRVYVDLGAGSAQFTSLAITMEPKEGSSAPTTSPVCVWGGKQS